MNMFYARVSTADQNLERQTEEAENGNYDKLYVDKLSGKNTDRPGLKSMMANLRPGDTVTVLSIDRLGRNTKDIINIVQQIKDVGCVFKCLSPSFSSDDAFGQFFIVILSAIAEMERNMILERQRQGIAIARAYGKYKGRKPKDLPDFESVYQQWINNKISSCQAAKLLDISRATFYRRVKKREEQEIIDI